MEILYRDRDVLVCLKEPGLLSTDEPGGVPETVRAELGDPNLCVKTVHRLDRVVGGVMVLAMNRKAASELSRQVREDGFAKEYLAVIHGTLPEKAGTLRDLLARDPAERKTYVVTEPGKDVREAVLDYRVLGESEGLSLVHIHLRTGRTHQIRAQFSSRGYPLWGDRKYSTPAEEGNIALWSCRVEFIHPWTKEPRSFFRLPPEAEPWNLFSEALRHME